MAVSTTLASVSVRMDLYNGYNAQTGEVKTVPVYLGPINPNTYDPEKALNIASAVSQCLTKTLYRTYEVRTNRIGRA